MENIQIRKAGPEDVALLQQISRTTFYEAFSAANTAENMDKYLSENFAATKLAEELNNPLSHFYFAMAENEVIGYLKLNNGAAQTELKEKEGIEIERIYVLNAWLGKKAGQSLYEHAGSIAQQTGMKYIWLAVWEENARAIRFYTKNGFVAFDKHSFLLGNDEQTDIMMKKTL